MNGNGTNYEPTDRPTDRPTAIDLFCGLGGWTDGLLAEGYRVIGFDNERHVYGEEQYPAQLVLQDVLTIHGRQFKDAALIVASPPCQAYSYRAMPWKRAKALPPPDNSLFDACFRIQREAIEAAGHFIPLVVENVRVSKEMRDAIWREYRPGQESDKNPSLRYLAVQQAAIGQVAFRPYDKEAAATALPYLVHSIVYRQAAIRAGQGDPLPWMPMPVEVQ